MTGNDKGRLYGDYRVIARDSDGDVVQTEVVRSTGSVTIEDVFTNVVLNSIEEIEVALLAAEVREDDVVKHRIETEADPYEIPE